jgi:hypothetical protein
MPLGPLLRTLPATKLQVKPLGERAFVSASACDAEHRGPKNKKLRMHTHRHSILGTDLSNQGKMLQLNVP